MRAERRTRVVSWAGLTLLALATLAAAALLPACADDADDEIVVSAASSLSDAFTEVARRFEAEQDGSVALNFGSSAALAVQLLEGAPAHVFASADAEQMGALVEAGEANDPVAFARNEIVVVTPARSTNVQTFEDLASDGVRLVLAGPEVPAGAYARQAIAAAGASGAFGADFEERVRANVASQEADVRAVLAKVELGEADAGIVYATDARAAGDAVQTFRIPAEFTPLVTYYIATLTDAPPLAQAFVDYVLSQAGQEILAEHGFTRAGG